jgi:hypothetical protein
MGNWETLFGSGHTDHLLPRKYKDLLWDDMNLVLSCAVCNSLKRHYDANSELPVNLRYQSGPLTEAQHTAVLEACRREVAKRRKEKESYMENALAQWKRITVGDKPTPPVSSISKDTYLLVLLSGNEQWNLARQQRPDAEPDLSGANLRGVNLQQFNLEGVNFTDACLSGANLESADLSARNISHANRLARIRGRPPKKAIGANLSGADLSFANLSYARLEGALLRGANLHAANLCGAGLVSTDLPRMDLSGCDLRCANLADVDLQGAELSGCDLRDADLSTVTGLTPEQIAVAVVDESTKLPLYLSF